MDIPQARAASPVVCTVGDLLQDVVVLLGAPVEEGTDTPARISSHRGGSAANVAAGVAREGVASRFIGRVGADVVGDALIGELRANGVETCVQRGGSTGTVVALVDGVGERSMLTDRGAATDLAEVDEAWLDDVAVLHVPAYSLTVEPLASTTRALVAAARRRGAAISVDTSSRSELVRVGVARFQELLAELCPEVLFASADEARTIGLDGPHEAVGLVVVTHGAGPTELFGDGVRASVAVPEPPAVVDSTGAGDAFAAGFLAARVRGADAHEATLAGHRAAGHVVATVGAVRT